MPVAIAPPFTSLRTSNTRTTRTVCHAMFKRTGLFALSFVLAMVFAIKLLLPQSISRALSLMGTPATGEPSLTAMVAKFASASTAPGVPVVALMSSMVSP